MFPLVLRGDKPGAAIELIDDLENRLFAALGRRLRDQKPPYPEVGRGALRVRDQRIRGLLHPVVNKFVGMLLARDQLDSDRLPNSRVDLILRGPEHGRERRDVGDIAETS